MIHAKIDDDAFLDTVRNARLIAFQRLEYGYAVAAPLVAFYAPVKHPGGGNLSNTFAPMLGYAFLERMSDPHLRTLRPTAKPVPTTALRIYLRTFDEVAEPIGAYPKARGDHPAVIEYECQVVIQVIEEHERPDLREAMKPAKLDMMAEALDLVVEHAESARELCEVSDERSALLKMHVLQATQALKTTLEMFLKP